jgi:hypothetical protein
LKKACSCFGLGRDLYYFTGTWAALDERKRPKTLPKLDGWATPEGWRRDVEGIFLAERIFGVIIVNSDGVIKASAAQQHGQTAA